VTSATPRPTSADLTALLADARRIAVVGLSSKPHRPSHEVARHLIDRGYEITPVNPNEREVLGRPAVASLRDLERPVDIVDVFRRPEHAPGIAADAVAIGAGLLWLQSGVTSAEARRIAADAGLAYVEDQCLGVAARLLLSRRP
jgi:uncharacterized protein